MKRVRNQSKTRQQNNFSNLKKLIAVTIFITIVTQINIAISKKIEFELKKNQLKKEIMLFPPDCCTANVDLSEYGLEEAPQIVLEELNIDVKPIK